MKPLKVNSKNKDLVRKAKIRNCGLSYKLFYHQFRFLIVHFGFLIYLEMQTEEIINKVAQSGLVSIDLKDFYTKGERVVYDLAQNLYQGLILKEKDFRQFLKEHQWQAYTGKNVAIICSADAIVPTWAYMLLAVHLEPYANHFVFGNLEELEIDLFRKKLVQTNWIDYLDKRVVIKGCSDLPIPIYAYVELARILRPITQSIMFGEPCSTVPIYKKKN